MGLIRQSAASFLKDAIVLDLGDLAAQGERIKAVAEKQANKVVEDAAKERARILEGATELGRKEGFERGREEGVKAGREEGRKAAIAEFQARLGELEKSWTRALESFENSRRRMLIDAERDVLVLALEIAGRIVRRSINTDPAAVSEQLAGVLALVTRPTRLVVRVNPEDEPLLRDALPALADRFPKAEHVELKSDASLTRGSCIAITAGGGVIDSTIETQLARITEVLVPDRSPVPPESGIPPGELPSEEAP